MGGPFRLVHLGMSHLALAVNDTEFIRVDFNDGKGVQVWKGDMAGQDPVVVVANFPDFATPNPGIAGTKRVNLLLYVRYSCYTCSMKITVELPDDLVQHADPGREALEALAIEGYRSGTLTHYQASQLLGLSRFEFDDFLMERNIHDHAYSIEDLEQDLTDLEKLRAQGLLGQ